MPFANIFRQLKGDGWRRRRTRHSRLAFWFRMCRRTLSMLWLLVLPCRIPRQLLTATRLPENMNCWSCYPRAFGACSKSTHWKKHQRAMIRFLSAHDGGLCSPAKLPRRAQRNSPVQVGLPRRSTILVTIGNTKKLRTTYSTACALCGKEFHRHALSRPGRLP